MNVTKHPLPNDSHGFRAFQKVDMSKLKVGDTIHDKGFTGVSRDYETARGYASEKDGNRDENEDAVHHYVARVHIPKGTKGLYADQVDHLMTREKETILHPGTSFKVTGKSVSHEEKDGKDHFHHIIHMTVQRRPKNILNESSDIHSKIDLIAGHHTITNKVRPRINMDKLGFQLYSSSHDHTKHEYFSKAKTKDIGHIDIPKKVIQDHVDTDKIHEYVNG
jgi:hypothetical protein